MVSAAAALGPGHTAAAAAAIASAATGGSAPAWMVPVSVRLLGGARVAGAAAAARQVSALGDMATAAGECSPQ